ncbi:FitA-like ribbon-helix-helix domain-containing protein [Geminocystis sp. CENA526]|uniref:FitA-like ribbon-helix-helix domain-containing protein n=1 Tax=Geminocystis sp. CENA526 TaxID=1355871 RepID=UPI003D6F644E
MANLTLENLPEELIQEIEQLAQKHHQSVNEQIISLLKQSVQKPKTALKFLVSPETDPTWEERCKSVPKLQAQIDQHSPINPLDYGFPDSTDLIREDRDR